MSWLQRLIAWINGFFAYLFRIIQTVFYWIWDKVHSVIGPYTDYVVDKYNELAAALSLPDVSLLADYYAAANLWVPLDEALLLVSLYIGLLVVVLTTRIVIRLIPFVG